jgi:release factor glutamine methyltransferase
LAEVVAGSSLHEALDQAVAQLTSAGIDTPRLDAELLLAQALGVGREQLVLRHREPIEVAALRRFEALVARRTEREPVAYILGRRAFRHIELAVSPAVLIPRPETELLVEVGLGLAPGSRVIDVGTGSGAVALALKYERADLAVSGTDNSSDAVAVARANARRLDLDVTFACTDLLEGADGPFEAVLANLPYVAVGADLPPEVVRYDPAEALFAGSDGLDQIRRLVLGLDGVPVVALEIGFDQAEAVADLLVGAGFGSVARLRDLAGHERVIVGRR